MALFCYFLIAWKMFILIIKVLETIRKLVYCKGVSLGLEESIFLIFVSWRIAASLLGCLRWKCSRFSVITPNFQVPVAADPPWAEEPPVSFTLWGTPRSFSRMGDVIPPPWSLAVIHCGITASRDRWKYLKGSLASSVHTRGLCDTDIFPPLSAHPLASVAWIQDVEVTSYVYVFTPDYATAQRGTLDMPYRSGYSDCQVSDSFRVGAGPYGQLTWLWLLRHPLFLPLLW